MSTHERKRPEQGTGQNRKRPRQDVVYTQAKAFNRKRFLLQLATVVAVVLALLFGMSIFFKVERVEIAGAEKYTDQQIQDASGINMGENLLTLNKKRISANIQKQLPYVYSVQVGRKLPGTVVIQITELNVTYAIQDNTGNWWLINSAGRVVDPCTAAQAQEITNILGVKLNVPVVGQNAVAYELPNTPGEDGTQHPVTVYESEKLSLALAVAQNMESNGLLGSVITKVDVSNIGDIQMWYETRFQIKLGDGTQLPKKLAAVAGAISIEDAYATGILDASFTVYPDGVRKTDFS